MRDNAAKVGMAVSEKRMDPEDQWSTNAGYLTDEEAVTWKTISSDSSGSSSLTSPLAELDTATSSPTGSHRGLIDDSPPHPEPAGNPSPSNSASTNDPPPQSPQPTPDNPPPSSPQPAPDNSHPPPSNLGPSTGPHQPTNDDSPPGTEPQHPGVPESEDFLSKLMKGKFKRHISSYSPGNVFQRVLEVARYRWPWRVSLHLLSLFCQRSNRLINKHSNLSLLNC